MEEVVYGASLIQLLYMTFHLFRKGKFIFTYPPNSYSIYDLSQMTIDYFKLSNIFIFFIP